MSTTNVCAETAMPAQQYKPDSICTLVRKPDQRGAVREPVPDIAGDSGRPRTDQEQNKTSDNLIAL